MCHPVSCVFPNRDGIDERLVATCMSAGCDQGRLAMGLRPERSGAHIRNPDLHGPQALLAQSLTMVLQLLS
jgi:hypothetical protein